MVLPTSGGAEAFTLIARAIAGRRPLVVHPQFTEPESALRRAGRVPDQHVLSAPDGFLLHPERVPADADLVFVGNPTNPTGVLHPRSSLESLRAPGRVLVVDEAFMDAIVGEPDSLISPDLEGVLVIRSLTKTWGLAGLRAGYVVGDPALLALLADHMRGRHQAPEFNFKVGTGGGTPAPVVHLREIRPEDYHRAAATLVDNPRALGFLAGFATDAVVTDKGFIARTAFDFSSARQELGKEFRNLAARLDTDRKRGRKEAPLETLWKNSLFGGPYAEQHSFGWDPATLTAHGQAAIAPTYTKPLAQPGLVWLAVESLPWHPVLPDGNGRDVIQHLRRHQPGLPALIITAEEADEIVAILVPLVKAFLSETSAA
mgnify:CR=1 FL=1